MQFRLLGPLQAAEQNVLVRRGAGRAGLAPDDLGTRYRSSLTGAGS
jgi:hypothetical protein